MRNFLTALLVISVAVSMGCRTLGQTQMSGQQITVVIGEAILDRPEKVKALRKYRGVEELYDYLQYYMHKGDELRQSLKVQVSITEFRLGWGRDMMGVEVQVNEDGEELTRFHLVDTTGRGSQVKRLSKALAKRINKELQEL